MTVLPHASRTHQGADLWILPDPKHSSQFAGLDWYLNFQLTRAHTREKPKPSVALVEILQKCDLAKPSLTEPTKDRLLISSEYLLPNRWVLQLSYLGSASNWCQQIAEVWTGLRKPTFRVFLPTGLSAGDFQSSWQQIHSFDDFSIVVD
jgi:hypothetical protein